MRGKMRIFRILLSFRFGHCTMATCSSSFSPLVLLPKSFRGQSSYRRGRQHPRQRLALPLALISNGPNLIHFGEQKRSCQPRGTISTSEGADACPLGRMFDLLPLHMVPPDDFDNDDMPPNDHSSNQKNTARNKKGSDDKEKVSLSSAPPKKKNVEQ